ncbi:MAG: hypothetical protein WKF81_07285 [Thermomicrobiales bacterium]
MTRRYPLELPPEVAPADNRQRRKSWLREDGFAIRAARLTASGLLETLDWRQRHRDLSQAIGTILLLIFGLSITASAGLIDEYLHRGVESGEDRPYIVQPAGKELATNVNLLPYTGDGLTEVVDALTGTGFKYVRQEFSWSEIEQVQGKPDFSRYEPMVAQLDRRRIQVIAVIVDAPEWAMVADPTSPDGRVIVDPGAFGSFTQALATQFAEPIDFVQIWDRPNLKTASPVGSFSADAFVRLLSAGASGARAGNTTVKVLLPELASVSDAPLGGSDIDYLNSLYTAGAAPYFDIVAIVLDGATYSPDDRQVATERFNMSRAILYRELMQDRDDSQRPIWATSFGWASSETMDRETQAEFVSRGLERSWEEWPWMGLMVQWQFLADSGTDDVPYSIVLPDGSPTPLYNRLTSEQVRVDARIAHTGFAPMNSEAVGDSGNWQDQHLEGRTFRTSSQVDSSITFDFSGTGLVAFMRSGPQVGQFQVELDGEIVPGGAGEDGTLWDFSWYETTDIPLTLLSGLSDSNHSVTITLASEGELTMGGMVVSRDAPFTWPIKLMAAAAFISLFLAIRSLVYLVAIRAGHLFRRGSTPNPELPMMPNWRPTRRV